MEVFPCSGVQYVGESDSAQQKSGTACIYNGDSNGYGHENQVQTGDGRVNNLLQNTEGLQIESQSGGHQSGASIFDCQVESHMLSSESHDFDDDDINVQNCFAEPLTISENSHFVDTIESEQGNSRDGESSLSELKWLEDDETVALWVKWRGKWQAGVRCARADWPLSTLRAKPTHDRKNYLVIFFPNTRNYSWADTLLVRSINEFPHPIAYKNHKIGLKMVKDLSVARRFIMKKLAVGMLNIVDQFHTEALADPARDVRAWKEFATEVSRCSNYSDLGRMLPKLQNMILKRYINSDWLQHSFQSWVQRCQVACSAESIELLKEELVDSILWNEINSLSGAQMQPIMSSEWKTWKHEVMKWFSISNLASKGAEMEQRSCDSPSTTSIQVSRKRPKLEVRRAETHPSQVDTSSALQPMTVEIDSEFFNNREGIGGGALTPRISQGENFMEGAAPVESPCSVADRWDGIVVEAGNSDSMYMNDFEVKLSSEPEANKIADSGNNNRQCIAFVESKGRQCVRWANGGDVYCCVHLASRFTGCSIKAEPSPAVLGPMCEGTTVLGTRCKHRSLPGFSFCKKHRPHDDGITTSVSPDCTLKRKHEESTPISKCKDMVLVEEFQSPLHVVPVADMDGYSFHGGNSLTEKIEHSSQDYPETDAVHCIGSSPLGSSEPCPETPRRYSLYCDKHIPSWLKRARNGKSRIISKEVFLELLKGCYSLGEKLHLHQACELFFKLFKSILSLRNPVPMDVQLQWAVSEASKDFRVGDFLLKLVCSEKERLLHIWGFSADEHLNVSSTVMEETSALPPAIEAGHDNNNNTIRCKICSQVFKDDQELSKHWMDNHKKEAQWLFRGYACALCLDSFTNKKVLESHVQERHHAKFVEQCMLLQCIPCHSHFGNAEELWSHVLSVHPVDFRLSNAPQQQNLCMDEEKEEPWEKPEPENNGPVENNSENLGGIRKFVCRFCGLKFDLLPDLGRHHQAAHMGPNLFSSRPPKKGVRYYAYKLKSGRLSRPGFKKGLGAAATYRIRNRASANLKKRIQESNLLGTKELNVQPPGPVPVPEASGLGILAESQCSAVAEILFSDIQKTKPRPNNQDILAIARTICCKISLKASLEGKYGILPERLYLKAAKLCSEHNILVEWHREGYICPRGCKSFKDPGLLSHLTPIVNGFMERQPALLGENVNNDWEMDESHYVIDLHDIRGVPKRKTIVLCDDISFGKELIPVACVVDEDLENSLHGSVDGPHSESTKLLLPWESFTYVTKPLMDESCGHDSESLQLGCACPGSKCYPELCDHVYLFDNDYKDAKDVYGKPIDGRFPYDDKGRIILEEGYLVYECNRICRCDKTCPNRVLQNGVRVKLEVFKTEHKGWAVRAGELILRGTFVCEYIGEVLDQEEADKRRERYGKEGASYMYKIGAHANDMSRLMEGELQYVIDATNYGNISRFINHSCSPNLVSHQVLVDSMDSQRAHIGLYASRDIAYGEELTYDYHYELLPGGGCPCHCGAPNCRGRLF